MLTSTSRIPVQTVELRKIAVRCCCVPQRVLGWFLVPAVGGVRLQAGARIRFRLAAREQILDTDPFWAGCDYLELPLTTYVDADGYESLAFAAAQQIPIEQLARADGFFLAH